MSTEGYMQEECYFTAGSQLKVLLWYTSNTSKTLKCVFRWLMLSFLVGFFDSAVCTLKHKANIALLPDNNHKNKQI